MTVRGQEIITYSLLLEQLLYACTEADVKDGQEAKCGGPSLHSQSSRSVVEHLSITAGIYMGTIPSTAHGWQCLECHLSDSAEEGLHSLIEGYERRRHKIQIGRDMLGLL